MEMTETKESLLLDVPDSSGNSDAVVIQGPKFWNYMYMLRQSATLCDAQLCIKHGQNSVSFPVHKVVLAASSRYFSDCLHNNDLLDVYNFDGISTDHLQSVIDYMYRQISWKQLILDPLGSVVAETLQLVYHDDEESPNGQFFRDVQKRTVKTGHTSKRVFIQAEEVKGVLEHTRLTVPKKFPGRRRFDQSMSDTREDLKDLPMYGKSEIDSGNEQHEIVSNENDLMCKSSEQFPNQESQNIQKESLSNKIDEHIVLYNEELQENTETTTDSKEQALEEVNNKIDHSDVSIISQSSDRDVKLVLCRETSISGSESVQETFKSETNTIHSVETVSDLPDSCGLPYKKLKLSPVNKVKQDGVGDKKQDMSLHVANKQVVSDKSCGMQKLNLEQSPITTRRATRLSSNGVNKPNYSLLHKSGKSVPEEAHKLEVEDNEITGTLLPSEKEVKDIEEKEANVSQIEKVKPMAKYFTGFTKTKKTNADSFKTTKVLRSGKVVNIRTGTLVSKSPEESTEKYLRDEGSDASDTSFNEEIAEKPMEIESDTVDEKIDPVLHVELIEQSTEVSQPQQNEQVEKSEEQNKNHYQGHRDHSKMIQPLCPESKDGEDVCPESTDCDEDTIEEKTFETENQDFEEGKSWNCGSCNMEFNDRESLCDHALEIHKTYLCTICDYSTTSSPSFNVHKKQFHALLKSYDCTYCTESFKYKKMFFKHLATNHDCKPYECEECSAKYVSYEGLRHHVESTHTTDLPQLMCELCGKSYKLKSQLTHHLTMTHKEEPDIPCKLCDRKFKQFSSLTRHLKTFHCDERNFKCEVCNRMFKTNDDKNKHMRRHFLPNSKIDQFGNKLVKHPTGLDYPCSHCGKVFQNFAHRKAHENIQHLDKQDGVSYLCTLCNKTFATRHYLNMHINNSHKPKTIECPDCSLKFHFKYELKRHRQKCKGYPPAPKPYRCAYCQKTFTMKGNLTKHSQLNRCRTNHPLNKNYSNPASSSDFVVVIQEDSDGGQVIGKVEIPLDQLQELGIGSADNIYEEGIEGNSYVCEQADNSEGALHEYILETDQQKAEVVVVQGESITDGQYTSQQGDSMMVYTSQVDAQSHQSSTHVTPQTIDSASFTITAPNELTYTGQEISQGSFSVSDQSENRPNYQGVCIISETTQNSFVSVKQDNTTDVVNDEKSEECTTDMQEFESEGTLVISEPQDFNTEVSSEVVTDNSEFVVYEVDGQVSSQFQVNAEGQIIQIDGEKVTRVQHVSSVS